MDPDSGSYFSSSMLFKASVLTLSFTAFYFYRPEKQFHLLRIAAAKKDSVVEQPVQQKKVKKKKKTIYLTFDDGPDKGTQNVMAILKEEETPATMFIIGEHVYGSRGQKATYDSLMQCSLLEIANHSFTHAFENNFYKFYTVPDSAVHDFERCADSLGLTSHIIRTPGRNIWRTENMSSTDLKASAAAGDSLHSKGFEAIGWDAEWHFNNEQRLVQTDSEMVNMVDSLFAHHKTKTAGHLVLLAHDRTFAKSDDSASLHRFITALKKTDEYNFETVSSYPGLTKDSIATK